MLEELPVYPPTALQFPGEEQDTEPRWASGELFALSFASHPLTPV